jgi:hypothetical protein
MVAPDGRRWDDSLFALVPRYSRLPWLDRALGGFWLSARMGRVRDRVLASLPAWRREQLRFLEAHRRFFANCLELNRSSLHVDGAKWLRRAELFASADLYDYRVIHLVRDGRGFCNSYIKNQKLERSRLGYAAGLWARSLRKIDAFRRRFLSVPLLRLRYEDLCRDPAGALTTVCNFLGVAYDPAVEVPVEARRCHIIGNRMRMTFGGAIELDRKWEDELTGDEIDRITALVRAPLQWFGYR